MNIILGNPEPVLATYEKLGVREWDENPICASMPLHSREELGQLLNFWPDYKKSERLLPHKVRRLLCQRVRNVFICTTRTLDTAEAVQELFKSSNLSRNPSDKVFDKWREKLIDLLRTAGEERKISGKKCNLTSLVSTLACEESPSMSIWGMPATGKSGVILRLLGALYGDRVVKHMGEGENDGFTHVRYLYLHNTVATSAKQAVISLLTQLGTLIGKDLTGKIRKHSKENIEDFALPELINYMLVYNVSAVFIDEVEMIKAAFSRGDESLRNFWLLLMNCRIPIVLIGNPDAKGLFDDSFKLQHRMCGFTTMIYDKLPYDGEWQFFLEELWEYQFTATETRLTEELKKAMYRHSQGLIKITMRLYVWTQRLAISKGEANTKGEARGDETITPELIEEAARKNAQTIERMILGLEGEEDNGGKIVLTSDLQMAELQSIFPEGRSTSADTTTPSSSEGTATTADQAATQPPKRRRTIRAGRVRAKRMSDCHKPACKGENHPYAGYQKLGKTRKVT